MITDFDALSRAASETASISCTSPAGVAGPAAFLGGAARSPPKITFQIDRFIARHMMYDRIAPLEPTSAPVMIKRSFCSMKPAAAAVHPATLLSTDTTTGLWAPAI